MTDAFRQGHRRSTARSRLQVPKRPLQNGRVPGRRGRWTSKWAFEFPILIRRSCPTRPSPPSRSPRPAAHPRAPGAPRPPASKHPRCACDAGSPESAAAVDGRVDQVCCKKRGAAKQRPCGRPLAVCLRTCAGVANAPSCGRRFAPCFRGGRSIALRIRCCAFLLDLETDHGHDGD